MSPVSGEVTDINQKIDDNVSLINESAEQDGWLIKIKVCILYRLIILTNIIFSVI